MGIHDRDYYQDEDTPQGFQLGGDGQRTMVAKIIMVTLAIYCCDAFTQPVDHQIIAKKEGADTIREVHPPSDVKATEKRHEANGYEVQTKVNSRWLTDLMTLNADLVHKPWNFWKLISNGFAHAPVGSEDWLFHIGFNMFVLFMFGRVIEDKYGPKEFLIFYVVAIAFSALAWLAVENLVHGHYDQHGVLGASGAVTAVVILFVMSYPNQMLLLMGVMPVKAWVLGLVLVGLNFLFAFGANDNVSYVSHLAGAGFGLLYFKTGMQLEKLWPKRLSDLFAWLRPKPRLKIHDPDEAEEAYREMDADADRILKKVHDEGEDSLTSKERRILDAYSRRMRQKHR